MAKIKFEPTGGWSRPLNFGEVRFSSDDNGYVYFYDRLGGNVYPCIVWTMNEGGWVAYLNDKGDPLFQTYQNSVPDRDTIQAVRVAAIEVLNRE